MQRTQLRNYWLASGRRDERDFSNGECEREIRPQTDNGTKTNGQAITRDRVEKQRVKV